jgi:ribose-phosphate pyrophosphokinase
MGYHFPHLKLFSGNSHRLLAQKIASCLKIDLGGAEVKTFPDGETFVRIEENVRGADVFIIQPTGYPANQHLMELLIMVDALKRASAARITAVMPFYGYARQDRKDQPRVPITAKLVANLLVTAGVDRVVTLDLHAQQIQGFFDIPLDHLYASPVFLPYLQQLKAKIDLVVLSPDIGSVKIAAAYAKLLDLPLGFVAKRRLNALTVEAFNLVGEVEGKDVLLVDDMTETMGTLSAAASLARSHGARSVRAVVTHCMLGEVGLARLKEGCLDELISTNSIPLDVNGLPITVLNVAPLFAEAIGCIHGNRSVTGLFRVEGNSDPV